MTSLPDLLEITGLKLTTRIGVHAWEQKIKQTVVLDLAIPCDYQAIEDKLEQVLDYDQLCQSLSSFIEANSFQLIETLANETAKYLKEQFKLKQFKLTLSKPKAIAKASNVSITVTR